MTLPDDVIVHHVGGAELVNLRLGPLDAAQTPPGLSILAGGTPQEAADTMRRVFKNSKKWQRLAGTVASATVRAIRAAGFEVIDLPTGALTNHARIVHPNGLGGFTDTELADLGIVFQTTTGC
jgi:anthranilate phosphoribosyltransferase